MYVSGKYDLEGILDGFWVGFGTPESSIFACFGRQNRSKNCNVCRKSKNSNFKGARAIHESATGYVIASVGENLRGGITPFMFNYHN